MQKRGNDILPPIDFPGRWSADLGGFRKQVFILRRTILTALIGSVKNLV